MLTALAVLGRHAGRQRVVLSHLRPELGALLGYPMVSLGSWMQPQDTGSIIAEGGLSPPHCSYLTSRSGHSEPCLADF